MRSNRKSLGKKKSVPVKIRNKGIYIASSILVILIAAYIVIKAVPVSDVKAGSAAPNGSDIKITKSQITETAAYIPYQAGNVEMELIAVKAPDGTVRTALNTCQVCYDSGRGYYVQEGNELVCQNCGNRFLISQIEKEKDGCNPMPILEDNKTDDGQTITITANYLNENAEYFENWKR